MIEEWKIIEDFKGYSISNYGNVKNNKTNKVLRQSHNKQKYSYV